MQAWQVAWGGHALLHQPLDYFQANTFWPLRQQPGLLGRARRATRRRALSAGRRGGHRAVRPALPLRLRACFLRRVPAGARARRGPRGRPPSRERRSPTRPGGSSRTGTCTCSRAAASRSRCSCCCAGYRQRRPGRCSPAGSSPRWQFSLGFTLGLQLAYLLAALGALAVAIVAEAPAPARAAARRWSPPPPPAPLPSRSSPCCSARPYMRGARRPPRGEADHARRSPASRRRCEAFIAAPEQNLVWGKATAGVRDDLALGSGADALPGPRDRRAGARRARRRRLSAAAAGRARPRGSLARRRPVARLHRGRQRAAPSLQAAVRPRARLEGRSACRAGSTTLTSLGARAARRRGRAPASGRGARQRSRQARSRRASAALVLVVAILIEGSGFDIGGGRRSRGPSHPAVPWRPPAGSASPAPQLHLPITIPANRRYVLWSTDGFPKIVNGRGSFDPRSFDAPRRGVERVSRPRLRRRSAAHSGVRTVVLHRDLAPGHRLGAQLLGRCRSRRSRCTRERRRGRRLSISRALSSAERPRAGEPSTGALSRVRRR